MRVVTPVTVADANLTSSTIPEPDTGMGEATYAGGTTYALGAQAISTSQHRVYESLQAANTGNPLPVLPETETAWWIDVGPTNKWAMFDLYRNTSSVESTSPLTAVIFPDALINTVAVLGMVGQTITITAHKSNGEEIYSYTENLITRDVRGWYDYYFEPFGQKSDIVKFDLPPYNDASVTISLVDESGAPEIAGVVLGSFDYIGEAQRDATLELVQFSRIDRDEFGVATLVPRPNIPTTETRVLIDSVDVTAVVNIIKALDAVPALWSTLDDDSHELFAPMLIMGINRKAVFRMADPDCELSLKLEEI